MANEYKNVVLNDSQVIAYKDSNGKLNAVNGSNNAILTTSIEAIPTSEAQLITRVITPVTASDVSENPTLYVSGSAGMVKSIKEYASNASSGDSAVLYTYYYENATYPTFKTKEVASVTTV